MGRAILPGRLQPELLEVKKFLLQQPNQIADYHLPWAQQLQQTTLITPNNVDEIIKKSLGQIFARVLEDAGVFKDDKRGHLAFARFIQALN